MFQSVRQLAERISSMIAERPFSWGVLTGLAAALALLLFFLLLAFLLRSRKLRCVAQNFPAFYVRRVGLFGKPDAVRLEVAMDFNGGDENVSVADLSAQFRAAVARMMTETFGMEKPARIEIEILRSGAEIPASGVDTEATEAIAAEISSESEIGKSC